MVSKLYIRPNLSIYVPRTEEEYNKIYNVLRKAMRSIGELDEQDKPVISMLENLGYIENRDGFIHLTEKGHRMVKAMEYFLRDSGKPIRWWPFSWIV